MQAVESATEDARFFSEPIKLDELPQLMIEISVLTPLRKIQDVAEIIAGKHGIVVDDNLGHRGVYLPQVAVEYKMDRDQFLSSCCRHKAGLPADAWHNLSTLTISIFQTQSVSEKN